MKNKYRAYDKWAVMPLHEYRGLSDKDKEWLTKFNTEWTNSNKVEDPLFNVSQRRESYRRKYHRMTDALTLAQYDDRGGDGHNPAKSIAALIDRHNRLQRVQNKSNKK